MIPSINLFDVDSAVIYERQMDSNGVWKASSISASYAFPCEPNTTYTVSSYNTDITIFRVGYITASTIGTGNIQTYDYYRGEAAGSYTLTTGASATYIVVQINAAIVNAQSARLQIEYGSTAHPYQPYINPALTVAERIRIDVANPSVAPVVRVVQEDLRSRYVDIELTENDAPLAVPAGVTGAVGVRTGTGVHILYDVDEDNNAAVTFDGNIATLYLRQEALANPDRLYVNLILRNSAMILTAFAFLVDVEAVAVPSGAVVQSDYFNYLSQQIEAAAAVVDTATGIVSDCTDEADRAKDEADRAQSYASGVQYPVSYAAQTLTTAQQEQARANISAASDAHASTHAVGGSDPLTPADIGAAAATALSDYVLVSTVGAVSGIATLDADGKVTAEQSEAAYLSINADTTLNNTHAGRVLLCSGTITITLASLSQGTELEIWNTGTGAVTIAGNCFVAGSGALTSCTIKAYSVAVFKRMNSTWYIAGGASA